jgi:GNAT superfamily N-acetyltransferase
MEHEGDLVELRLARGCRCFGGWSGSEVIAYGWLSAGPEWIGELGLEITPALGEAYVWNCVTLPEHRRRGVFRGLLQCLVATAAAEGLTRLWIASVDDLADRAILDAGFRSVLKFESRSFAGWRHLRIEPARDAPPALIKAAHDALRSQYTGPLYRVKTRRH